jgi:hypothetical protein
MTRETDDQIRTGNRLLNLVFIILGFGVVDLLLKVFDHQEHRGKSAVHLTKTDRAKDSIPVRLEEGENSTGSISMDLKDSIILVQREDQGKAEAESKRQEKGSECAHLGTHETMQI